jgi:hypothetical protein
VKGVTQAHKGVALLLAQAATGLYTVHVRRREGDRMEKYATQHIEVTRHGSTVVRGNISSILELTAEAMDAVEGGYLMLTLHQPGRSPTSAMWQILAGHLLPLEGDQAWHVSQFCREGQGSGWLSANTEWEDAWPVDST